MRLISMSLFHLYLDLHANGVITGQLAGLRLGSGLCQQTGGSCLRGVPFRDVRRIPF